MRAPRRSAVVLAALASLACTTEPAPTCENRPAPVSAPDRRLLGAANDYPADGMLIARQDALLASQRARRAAAWDVIARVVEAVPLAETVPVADASVPRFRTWYDATDFRRAFGHAYEAIGPDARAAHARMDEATLDDAFAANVQTQETLGWTDAEWSDYVARFRDGQDLANLGGVGRIGMSPAAARHVARSYPEIARCVAEGAPPAFVDGMPTRTLATEHVVLDGCARRTFGPYWVASTGTLTAHLNEGEGVDHATLRVLVGDTITSATARCSATGIGACASPGPGATYVEVSTGAYAVDAMLSIDYAAPDVAFASCLDGVFPLAAATVAQEWRRVELGPLPTFDTSSAGLARRLAADGSWGAGDGTAEPDAAAIYTQRVDVGSTFRLAGMHIRTRELDHWMNITMWWTDHPDQDFGADRPSTLTGPWAHYAMCVAVDDVESDPDAQGGFEDLPSLGAALEAVRSGTGGPSWCSNPYIDAGPGAVRTNCVGCHQHAMSGVLSDQIVTDEAHFPATGRLFMRDNFPSDAFWGLDGGDRLAYVIQDVLDYWTSP